MSVTMIRTMVTVVRMPEPGEEAHNPPAFEAPETDVHALQYGRPHRPRRPTHTMIPWHRVLRIETRKYAE